MDYVRAREVREEVAAAVDFGSLPASERVKYAQELANLSHPARSSIYMASDL